MSGVSRPRASSRRRRRLSTHESSAQSAIEPKRSAITERVIDGSEPALELLMAHACVSVATAVACEWRMVRWACRGGGGASEWDYRCLLVAGPMTDRPAVDALWMHAGPRERLRALRAMRVLSELMRVLWCPAKRFVLRAFGWQRRVTSRRTTRRVSEFIRQLRSSDRAGNQDNERHEEIATERVHRFECRGRLVIFTYKPLVNQRRNIN